jgi:hypothetical protein
MHCSMRAPRWRVEHCPSVKMIGPRVTPIAKTLAGQYEDVRVDDLKHDFVETRLK